MAAGSTVTFTYVVTNTGNVPLANVVVTDDKLGPITSFTGDTNSNGLLDLTETWTYTRTATALAGQQTNIGTVTAQDANNPPGTTVTDNNPANYFGDTVVVGKSVAFSGSMEGALEFQPGAEINGGFRFHVGTKQASFVETVTSQLALPIHCGSANGPLAGAPITFQGQLSRGVIVDMGTRAYVVPANSTHWILTDDPKSILVWNECHPRSRPVRWRDDVQQRGGRVPGNLQHPARRAHLRAVPLFGSVAKNKSNTDCTNAADPNRNRADVCGPSWSSTQGSVSAPAAGCPRMPWQSRSPSQGGSAPPVLLHYRGRAVVARGDPSVFFFTIVADSGADGIRVV